MIYMCVCVHMIAICISVNFHVSCFTVFIQLAQGCARIVSSLGQICLGPPLGLPQVKLSFEGLRSSKIAPAEQAICFEQSRAGKGERLTQDDSLRLDVLC